MTPKTMTALCLCLCLCLATAGAVAPANAQVPGLSADAAHAAPDEAAMTAAHEAYTASLAGRLADSGDARNLALAAWLRDLRQAAPAAGPAPPVADAQARAWRGLAFQRAGTDPVALALLSGAAAAAPDDPVPAQALARWRQLEPSNLVPALLAGVQGAELIAAAGHARSAHGHAVAQVRWIADAVRRHPPDAATLAVLAPDATGVDGLAVMTGWSYLAGYALPDYGVLVDACRRTSAETAAACRNAATVLQAGDTRQAEAVGLSLARDLAPTREARRAAEAARLRFDWQMFETGHLSGRAPAQQLGEYVRLLGNPALDTEAALNLEQLRLAGIPLDPPPGWRPPH